MQNSRSSEHFIEVRFSDIDAMGHVNNAVYLTYFEQARIAWFNDLIAGEWNWQTDGIVLARNEVDYIEPVTLNDRVRILTQCEHVGKSSLVVSYQVFRLPKGQVNERLCTKGKSILVCFDYNRGEKREVPALWREKLQA
jgi:acyl-CoA thioester hydrolase